MRLTFLFLVFILPYFLIAQSKQMSAPFHQNQLSLSLGGGGLVYSLNYERLLLKDSPINYAIEIGAAYYPKGSGFSTLWLPVSVNTILFQGKHHLETGIGAAITSETWTAKKRKPIDGSDYFATLKIGYRYQAIGSRFVFRTSFMSFFETYKFFQKHQNTMSSSRSNDKFLFENDVHPWGGIALGYVF